MLIWMRWSAKSASLLSSTLVCLTVLAFAASASVPTMRGRSNAMNPPRVPGLTPGEARQALIEMLEKIPENRNAAPIIQTGLDRLRRGAAFRLVDDDNRREVDWEFNCDMKAQRFSFFTEPQRPTLKSFHSEGRFAFEDGRWHVRDFHWEWLTCFDRSTERSRQRALKPPDHRNGPLGFATP